MTSEPKKKLKSVSIPKLFKFSTTADKRNIALALICTIINGICSLFLFLILSEYVGKATLYLEIQKQSLEEATLFLENCIIELSYILLAFGFIFLITGYGQFYLWMLIGERQSIEIRRKYYKAILGMEMSWFDGENPGRLSSMLSGDIDLIREGISQQFGMLVQQFATFFFGVVIAFINGWKLAIVLFTTAPLLIGGGMYLAKCIKSYTRRSREAQSKAGAIVEEVVSSIKTVCSFGSKRREIERFEHMIDEAKKIEHKRSLFSGIGIGIIIMFQFLNYGLGMWYGSKLIIYEGYTPKDVIAIFFSSLYASKALSSSFPSISSIAVAQGAAARVFDIIERKSKANPFLETVEMESAKNRLGQFDGEIELKNVDFSYPSRPDSKVLDSVSLKIKSGTQVALVGPSGSGKSTIISLILRLYGPTQGNVLIDNFCSKDLSIKFLREHISIVSQEPVLFATTIRENILLGLSNDMDIKASDDILQKRIEHVCKIAYIHDFILSLPDKYETLVGKKGTRLSGGQKQRIAIARALIKDPKILLLDEATSALDVSSEEAVQIALNNASKGRTTVSVAHRLCTIQGSDKIIVLDKGKIVEEGTHEELLRKGNVYYALAEKQSIKSQDNCLKSDNILVGGKNNIHSVQKSVDSTFFKSKEIIFNSEENEPSNPGKSLKGQFNNIKGWLIGMYFNNHHSIIFDIFKMTFEWWPYLSIGLVGTFMHGAISPILSLLLTNISISLIELVDPLTRDMGIENTNIWCLAYVAIAIVSVFTSFSRFGILSHIGNSLSYKIRLLSFKAYLRQDISYFDDKLHRSGAITTRLSVDSEKIQGVIMKVIGPILLLISDIMLATTISFLSGWKLTLVTLSALVGLVVVNLAELKFLTTAEYKAKKAYEASFEFASESIANIKTVAGLSIEPKCISDFEKMLNSGYLLRKECIMITSAGYALSMSWPSFFLAISFFYGSYLVANENYGFKQVLQISTSLFLLGETLAKVSTYVIDYANLKAAALDFFDLLKHEPSIDDSEEVGQRPAKVQGNIDFKDANFSYLSRPGMLVLKNINFNILAGKNIAFVGSSGSGKSTIISLIQRFYDVEKGTLEVEGVDIKEWNIPYLRSGMALVSQEPTLFDLTIGQNISYGKPMATFDEIMEAAKKANIHDFITSLPNGYDTPSGLRGSQLSGGQKQRIAIARALILNPKLLLLDEATSALDSNSERLVQDAISKASEGRTTLTIAHRLSTVQNADTIFVLKDGRIVEKGSHIDLLNNHGYYRALIDKQNIS